MSFPPALPHGPIVRVTDGVHTVRGTFAMGPGIRIGRTMTILERAGTLVVLNAIRLSAEGEAALDRLGKVAHLVKLSDSHSLDEPYYADKYRPEVWAMAGAKLGGLEAKRELGKAAPLDDSLVLDYPGSSGWRECALLVKTGGGTLVTCDAIQNHVDAEGASFLGRIMTPLLGFKGGVIVPKMWRKYQKLNGEAVRNAFAPILEHSFSVLSTGHGPAITGEAATNVRKAVEAASL
jgi:hypothetical protein